MTSLVQDEKGGGFCTPFLYTLGILVSLPAFLLVMAFIAAMMVPKRPAWRMHTESCHFLTIISSMPLLWRVLPQSQKLFLLFLLIYYVTSFFFWIVFMQVNLFFHVGQNQNGGRILRLEIVRKLFLYNFQMKTNDWVSEKTLLNIHLVDAHLRTRTLQSSAQSNPIRQGNYRPTCHMECRYILRVSWEQTLKYRPSLKTNKIQRPSGQQVTRIPNTAK